MNYIEYMEYAILIYHPVTTELEYIEQNTQTLLNALCKTNDNFIVIYPNNDPAINIGNRQQGRYDKNKVHNIQSIGYTEDKIMNAIKNIRKYKKKSNFYGEGNSSEIIADILSKKSFWQSNLQKVFYDLNIKNIR